MNLPPQVSSLGTWTVLPLEGGPDLLVMAP